jgi:succinate-semialdehyde dehydrogenase/glutarate-semialdehyde dehydrogenase
MAITSVNPTTGQTIRTYAEHSSAEVEEALGRAREAFGSWRRVTFAERGRLMTAAAARLRAGAGGFAVLMATEMGKPVAQGRSEIEKCAWTCDFFAQHAASYLASEPVATDAAKSFIAFEPLGVVLAVMPWNFPFWQVFRFAAPTLMAGNTAVLKHASNVPGCALAVERVFREAGFPAGVFQTLMVESPAVAGIIAHPAVSAVTLTGGTPAGKAIASKAGSELKKTVLELGGSDPYIVLEDADLDAAASTCVSARLTNGGQSCVAAKRFIVVEPVRKAFEERFIAGMRAQAVGDPLREDTQVGPLARRDLRDGLHDTVQATIRQGATLALGGVVPDGPGAFYPPTVLTGVRPGMAAHDHETFGPVAAVVSAKDEAEAISIANHSPFGLGAVVFTRDRARGERIAAKELEAGCCFVNALVRSDPRLPFGGIKQSGYGRELSAFGIREFVNIKTVYIT